MAKTIEELKESINNTINQNGSGQITGQGLNILLNEMADVLSTMGGNTEEDSKGGAGGVYVVVADSFTMEDDGCGGTEIVPTLTKPENIKINKNAYDTIHESLKNKQGISVYLSLTEYYNAARKEGEEISYNKKGYLTLGIISMIVNESTTGTTKEELMQQMPEYAKYWGTEVYRLEGDLSLQLFNDGNVIFES